MDGAVIPRKMRMETDDTASARTGARRRILMKSRKSFIFYLLPQTLSLARIFSSLSSTYVYSSPVTISRYVYVFSGPIKPPDLKVCIDDRRTRFMVMLFPVKMVIFSIQGMALTVGLTTLPPPPMEAPISIPVNRSALALLVNNKIKKISFFIQTP